MIEAYPLDSQYSIGTQRLGSKNLSSSREAAFSHAPLTCPAHVQAPGGEVDVVPAQRHDLRGSEAVAVRDQDGRGVPVAGAVLLGGLDEPLHLPLGEIREIRRMARGSGLAIK